MRLGQAGSGGLAAVVDEYMKYDDRLPDHHWESIVSNLQLVEIQVVGGKDVGIERYCERKKYERKSLQILQKCENVSALSTGPERSERHEANYLLSYHHLRRPSDKMEFSKFLRVPKIHRRVRSETRGEISPIEGQSEADLAAPRPTESTPDLRTDISTSSTTRPSVSRDQESNGMQKAFFRIIYLTTFFA